MTDLPNRRPAEIRTVSWGEHRIHVSVGRHPADGRAVEVFARLGRSGSLLDSLLDEGSILISRLLQAGVSPAEIAKGFGRAGDEAETPLGAVVDVLTAVAAKQAGEGA